MTDYDSAQGALIHSLQKNVLQITLILQIIVTIFSIAFSQTFSRRLKKIMSSMRIIQNGDFSHKLSMSGNDELTILANEFNDLTERLQTSEQKRRRFVSDASHELKTPLASIKLLTDSILQNDMDMETIKEFVEDIAEEAERLNRTAQKLLDLTRGENSTVEDAAEIMYMEPSVRKVVQRLSPLADSLSVSINLQILEDTPIFIRQDDLYLILFNLVENGIKYNLPNGTLTISLSRSGNQAVLLVSDTGVGIPEQALGKIFERFYRVDKARSRATGGSGLGLAIVRSTVERSNGSISVESQPEKGTTFTVMFPACNSEVIHS
jgi:signal transduction histidine kinase